MISTEHLKLTLPWDSREDWQVINEAIDFHIRLQMKVNLKDIPNRIYIRYGLLMIPGMGVAILILIVGQRWVSIPAWLFWTLIGFWLVKDVLLFPFVWRSYDWERPGISRSMVGKRGIAIDRLAPEGYIRVQGELWKAEKTGHGPPVEKGEVVRIERLEGLKLFVVRDPPEDG